MQNYEQKPESYEISARLFKTIGGKYVAGVEVYNRTRERYVSRDGLAHDTLEALARDLVHAMEQPTGFRWLDDDILGELFEDTELADQFIEEIE